MYEYFLAKQLGSALNSNASVVSSSVAQLPNNEAASPFGLFKDPKKQLLLLVLAFILIASSGLVVRLDAVKDWLHQPDRALFNDEPILTTFDGYYYLTLARDMVEGTYNPVDERRAVPESPMRPSPAPLMSVMAATVAAVTPYSLNWIGVVLPAILGVLLIIPVYGIGRAYGGSLMGLVAAMVAVLSPFYVARSGLGWFDTDCMLVTWVMMASWLAMRFAEETTLKRHYYLAAALVNWMLTLWWWDQTPHVATILVLSPLFAAMLFFYRPPVKQWFISGFMVAIAIGVVLSFFGADLFLNMFNRALSMLGYVSKQANGPFPNIGVSISEQVKPDLQTLVDATTGNLWVLMFAASGLVAMLWNYRLRSVFIAAPIGLALLGGFTAFRFLIFAAPIVGLGIAYLVHLIWRKSHHQKVFSGLAILFAVACIWPIYDASIHRKGIYPTQQPAMVKGIHQLSELTPSDAVAWSWWDNGYPINYWGRRATISDGQKHGGERSMYNAIPYVTANFRLSANFMQFYVSRGMGGIHAFYEANGGDIGKGYKLMLDILANGPEKGLELIENASLKPNAARNSSTQWLEFFYPQNPRPVNFFIDWRLTKLSYWWFWLGSWDVDKKAGMHPYYKAHHYARIEVGKLKNNFDLNVDLEAGEVMSNGTPVKVSKFYLHDGVDTTIIDYEVKNGLIVEFFEPTAWAVVQEDIVSRSVFNQLLLRHIYPKKYFDIVVSESPAYQIWSATADPFPGKYIDTLPVSLSATTVKGSTK